MISQKSYEVIRWLIAVFLPAFGVLFSTLAEAWAWDVPVKAFDHFVGYRAVLGRYFRYF